MAMAVHAALPLGAALSHSIFAAPVVRCKATAPAAATTPGFLDMQAGVPTTAVLRRSPLFWFAFHISPRRTLLAFWMFAGGRPRPQRA